MSEYYNGFLVILEEDIRAEDAKPIIAAIRQLRGVLNVKTHDAREASDAIADTRIRYELTQKLFAVLKEKK